MSNSFALKNSPDLRVSLSFLIIPPRVARVYSWHLPAALFVGHQPGGLLPIACLLYLWKEVNLMLLSSL